MTTTFGATPNDSLGIVNTKDLQPLTQSGWFEVQITSATYNKITSKKNGNEYQQLQLGLATMVGGNATAKLNLSIFISSTSQELQDLVYFCNIRDANGNLYLPDPVEHKWTNKEGAPVLNKEGQQIITYDFKPLINKRVHAIVIFKGMTASANGNQYPVFELTGFTSAQGKSAYEDASKAPAVKYKSLIDLHQKRTVQQPAPVQPPMQQHTQGPIQSAIQSAYNQQINTAVNAMNHTPVGNVPTYLNDDSALPF